MSKKDSQKSPVLIELYRKECKKNTTTYCVGRGFLIIGCIDKRSGLTSGQMIPIEDFYKAAYGFKSAKDWCKQDVRRFRQMKL